MRLKLRLAQFIFILFSFIIAININSTPIEYSSIEYTHVGKLDRIELLNFKPVETINTTFSVDDQERTVVAKAAPVVSRNTDIKTSTVFTITAYDLSVQSCGKPIGHPNYGLTASGFNLTGLNRTEAMTIAVDKNIIPLGSKVYLEFLDDNYAEFNGVYTARDTGGAIKKHKIDLFMGDFNSNKASQEAINFGVTKAYATILK